MQNFVPANMHHGTLHYVDSVPFLCITHKITTHKQGIFYTEAGNKDRV